jgi:hypothetical protein
MAAKQVFALLAVAVGLFSLQLGLNSLLLAAVPGWLRRLPLDGPPESLRVARRTEALWGDGLRRGGFVRLGATRQRYPLGRSFTEDVWLQPEQGVFALCFWALGRPCLLLASYTEEGGCILTRRGSGPVSRGDGYWRQSLTEAEPDAMLDAHQPFVEEFFRAAGDRFHRWRALTLEGQREASARLMAAHERGILVTQGVRGLVMAAAFASVALSFYQGR